MAEDLLALPSLELGVYEHYKGKQYEVLGVGLHSETLEPLVVYMPLYESSVPVWVRPYKIFISLVTVDGKEVPRFRRLS